MLALPIMFGWSTQNILNFIYTITLESVFLGFCVILMGLSISEIKKRRHVFGHTLLFLLGGLLILVSFYVSRIFLEG